VGQLDAHDRDRAAAAAAPGETCERGGPDVVMSCYRTWCNRSQVVLRPGAGWHHRVSAGDERFDLCTAELAKLSPAEQAGFVEVRRPADLGAEVADVCYRAVGTDGESPAAWMDMPSGPTAPGYGKAAPNWLMRAVGANLDVALTDFQGSYTQVSSPGRHYHSTLSLAAIDWHCLGICTVILLPLLSFLSK
jgi:hypothetical protein